MIRCVVFDFDGTLVLSNAIKRDGFFALATDFPDGAAAMERLLADPPGDRFAILEAFAAPHGADADDLAARYGKWCEERILSCPERTGAAAVLVRLRYAGLRLYVNSATPTAPLQAIVARRYASGTFDGVLGGHGAKLVNLEAIAATEELTPVEMLMVGDGIDDRDAAADFGCAFAGVAEGTLAASDEGAALPSSLMDVLQGALAPMLGAMDL